MSLSGALGPKGVLRPSVGDVWQFRDGAWQARTSLAALDWTSPTVLSGAATLSGSVHGKVFLCIGTTADYTVSLAAVSARAGDLVAFVMGSTTALTKFVTIDAGSGKTIDDSQSRVMWSNEVAVLQWNGTAWNKIAGKSLATSCLLSKAANQTITTATVTLITLGTTDYDSGGMADLANNRILIRRTSEYLVKYQTVYATNSLTGTARLHKNTANLENAETSNGQRTAQACTGIRLTAGDNIDLRAYHTEGANRDCASSLLVAMEIVQW